MSRSFSKEEIRETLRMIEGEHLDIRTVTLGINILDCGAENISRLTTRIRSRILSRAERLVEVAEEVEATFGVPIVNKRVSITPIALVAPTAGPDSFFQVAKTLDALAGTLGIDYLAGFSALVHKGMTAGDTAYMDSLAQVLASTQRLCCSVNVATSKAGINIDACNRMAQIILDAAHRDKANQGLACARLVVFANAVEDNPFIAGAMHGIGEPDAVINVGVSGPGVVRSAIASLRRQKTPTLDELAEAIKRMSFKITRAGELIGRQVAERLGEPVQFGVVDLSLAPTPAVGDSIAEVLEIMGVGKVGAPGTTAALAMLTDAVKKGGLMASSRVGGLSGAFIPVSEDAGMIQAVQEGVLSLEKLEAMTSVCSVGLDMVAIPGDVAPATIAGILADEAAIGVMNNKTTAVRILPIPGGKVGDLARYGGLLGDAPVMAVNPYTSEDFLSLGGSIPAPLQSLRN